MGGGDREDVQRHHAMPTRQLPMPPSRAAAAHASPTKRPQPQPPPRSPQRSAGSRTRPLPQQPQHKALPQAPQDQALQQQPQHKALPQAPRQQRSPRSQQRALPQAPHAQQQKALPEVPHAQQQKALPQAPHAQQQKALPQRPHATPPGRVGRSPAAAAAARGHASTAGEGHDEAEVAEQLKEKIAAQALDVEELRLRIEEGGGDAGLRRELEEGETLLQALYANLQALAEERQAAAEAARQDSDVAVLVEMRSRVAAQVLAVENCRTEVLNCSGSYEEKLAAQKHLEEQLTLLEALQANLEALQGSCGVHSPARRRNRSGTEALKKIGSRLSSFSFRQPAQDVTLSAPRPGRAASHAPPVAAVGSPPAPRMQRAGSALPTVESDGNDSAQVSTPAMSPLAPRRTGASVSPLAQRKANRIVHTTSKVDDVTSQTKKHKKRARIAHEADDEKSSVGAKKKFYCCLCACEDFEVSPPPKPENCRNCKHEFQAHRLHQIKGVRLDRELFKNCIKAQLSFFI